MLYYSAHDGFRYSFLHYLFISFTDFSPATASWSCLAVFPFLVGHIRLKASLLNLLNLDYGGILTKMQNISDRLPLLIKL